MNKKIVIFVALMACLACSNVFSEDWSWNTEQLTSNSYNDNLYDFHALNDNGDVVWRGYTDSSHGDIFKYDNSLKTTTRLTTNISSGSVMINSGGDVVWDGGYDIFLFNNSTKITSQLTNTSGPYGEQFPYINANRDMVWSGQQNINLYNGATGDITQIGTGGSPRINSAGDIVYHKIINGDYDVVLYDGATTTNLSNKPLSDNYPKVSENGYVAWQGDDPAANGIDSGRVYIYDGSAVLNLGTKFSAFDLSDNGKVAWFGKGTDGKYGIYAYDGTLTKLIYESSYTEARPNINNDGNMVWQGKDANNVQQIYTYIAATGEIQQLTNALGEGLPMFTDANRYPQLNNNNDIVWQGFSGGNYEIYKASVTPEPASMLLFGLGGLAMAAFKRRKISKRGDR